MDLFILLNAHLHFTMRLSNKNAADEILKMQNAYLIKDKIRVMSTMFPQGR